MYAIKVCWNDIFTIYPVDKFWKITVTLKKGWTSPCQLVSACQRQACRKLCPYTCLLVDALFSKLHFCATNLLYGKTGVMDCNRAFLYVQILHGYRLLALRAMAFML